MGLHLAIGIQNSEQDRFHAASLHGYQIGPRFASNVADFVAGGTVLGKKALACFGIACGSEAWPVRFNEFVASHNGHRAEGCHRPLPNGFNRIVAEVCHDVAFDIRLAHNASVNGVQKCLGPVRVAIEHPCSESPQFGRQCRPRLQHHCRRGWIVAPTQYGNHLFGDF